MTVAVVSKLVVRRRKLLEALCSDGGEITFEISELNEDHRAASDETVDQRLLRHSLALNPRSDPIDRLIREFYGPSRKKKLQIWKTNNNKARTKVGKGEEKVERR